MAAAEQNKKAKLATELLQVLREKNRELEKQVRSATMSLHEAENNALVQESRANSAEKAITNLYSAVRVLADEVGNNTAQGRRVRHEARILLEQVKLTPPASLGKTRTVTKKKRQSKKKS